MGRLCPALGCLCAILSIASTPRAVAADVTLETIASAWAARQTTLQTKSFRIGWKESRLRSDFRFVRARLKQPITMGTKAAASPAMIELSYAGSLTFAGGRMRYVTTGPGLKPNATNYTPMTITIVFRGSQWKSLDDYGAPANDYAQISGPAQALVDVSARRPFWRYGRSTRTSERWS